MPVLPTFQSSYIRQEKHVFRKPCVSQMPQKNAIYQLKNSTTAGFCSRSFLIPKPGKKWCPVIDLSVLCKYLLVPSLKMTQRIPTSTSVSCGWSNLSVSSTAIQACDRSPRIYTSCKTYKAYSSILQNSSSPVPGWLVDKSKFKIPVSSSNKRTHPNYARPWLYDKL